MNTPVARWMMDVMPPIGSLIFNRLRWTGRRLALVMGIVIFR
jgi:hypothetical protein